MVLKRIIIVIFLILEIGTICSQQLPFSNQFMVNKHYLSPAYSGFTDNYETFITHGKDWQEFQGAPEYSSFYISGPIYENLSFGGSMAKNSITIFNAYSAQIDIAYHLKVNENQYIHFGISSEYNENYISTDNQTLSAQNDPYLLQQSNSFNAGFGLIYTYKTFQIGMAIPRMFNSNSGYSSNGSESYKLSEYFRIHTSYLTEINQSFSSESFIIIDKSDYQPIWYTISNLFKYKNFTWIEIHYTQGNIMGVSFGINPLKKLLINYTYEFSNSGLVKNSKGNHEIVIGFLIGKNKEKKYQKSAFMSLSKQPYNDWIK